MDDDLRYIYSTSIKHLSPLHTYTSYKPCHVTFHHLTQPFLSNLITSHNSSYIPSSFKPHEHIGKKKKNNKNNHGDSKSKSTVPNTYQHQQISAKTMLLATVVGLTIGGPLLAMMGFSFIATMTLFVVSSPLFIIFSPLIAGAMFVFLAALVGFAAAGTMAILGLAALGWVFQTVKSERLTQGIESAAGKLVDYGENVKENVKDSGKDWGNQLKQTVQNSPDDKTTTANKA